MGLIASKSAYPKLKIEVQIFHGHWDTPLPIKSNPSGPSSVVFFEFTLESTLQLTLTSFLWDGGEFRIYFLGVEILQFLTNPLIPRRKH